MIKIRIDVLDNVKTIEKMIKQSLEEDNNDNNLNDDKKRKKANEKLNYG